MMGNHAQEGFFQADRHLLDYVGRNTFYGRLAALRGQLFRDEDFSELYCADNGRPSVSPALLATATLLQVHDRCSDGEAKQRADYDLRWKVALGVASDERPFAKSTLQKFRAQLIVHDRARQILRRSIEHARTRGLIRGRSMKLALDTTAILGKGAVRDAYNLIGDGVRLLIGALAELARQKPEEWAREHGYSLHAGKSLKGGAGIDWSDRRRRRRFLGRIVRDADSLLERARQALDSLPGDDERALQILSCSRLLAQILIQDVKRAPASEPDKQPPAGGEGPGRDRLAPGSRNAADAADEREPADPRAADGEEEEMEIVRGGGRDRIVSVHDPQMRHGRKSARHVFAGHKAAVAADVESGVITAVAVIPGNAPDNRGALDLVRRAEENAAAAADVVIGDCAYGDGDTRADFADAGYDLLARLPGRPRSDCFVKQDFAIDLGSMTCTCPAGHQTSDYRRSRQKNRAGLFHFARERCVPCPLRGRCIRSAAKPNRRVSVHPQERLLQQARVRQQSAEGRALGSLRVVIEHRLARLRQLGIGRSRFFGRLCTNFQLQMAAAVANLTLAEGDSWRKEPSGPDPAGPEPAAACVGADRAAQLPPDGGGRDIDGEIAAAAAVGAMDAGYDGARDCPRAPASGSGLEPAARDRTRVVAAANRIGAFAAASIAAVAGRLGVSGRRGVRNGSKGRRDDFRAIADPFATRSANWALRPGL